MCSNLFRQSLCEIRDVRLYHLRQRTSVCVTICERNGETTRVSDKIINRLLTTEMAKPRGTIRPLKPISESTASIILKTGKGTSPLLNSRIITEHTPPRNEHHLRSRWDILPKRYRRCELHPWSKKSRRG